MLSFLYKAFSAVLVVSVVFFSNNSPQKHLWNACTTSLQGAYRASCIPHGFFFSGVFQTKLHCSINNTCRFLLGFSCFFSVTVYNRPAHLSRSLGSHET